jgi:hypothetical protein
MQESIALDNQHHMFKSSEATLHSIHLPRLTLTWQFWELDNSSFCFDK